MIKQGQLLSAQNLNNAYLSLTTGGTQGINSSLTISGGVATLKTSFFTDNASSGYLRIDPQGNQVIVYDGVNNQQLSVYSSSGSETIYLQGVNQANNQSYGLLDISNASSMASLNIGTISNKPIIFGGEISTNSNTFGINLNSGDYPLITRGWDRFSSGKFNGIGRWGMVMEPSTLTIATPSVTSNGNVQFARYNPDSTIASVSMYINSSGKVGIGTTSPTEILTVNGNIDMSGVNGRRIYMGNVAGGNWGIAYSSANPNFGFFYLEGSPDNIYLSPDGSGANSASTNFTFTGSGQLGIGKSPSQALDVNGGISATAGISIGGGMTVGSNNGSSSSTVLSIYSNNVNGGELQANTNGNLWLNANGGKTLWLNWLSPVSPSTYNNMAVGNGNSGSAILWVQGSNNRVGINNTSPTYALDVIGDIRAQNAWLRTTGSTGWYSDTYGGGMYMSDSTWIRTYGGKSFYVDNYINVANGYQIGGTNVIDSSKNLVNINQGKFSGAVKIQAQNDSSVNYYPNIVACENSATVTGGWIIHTPISRTSNVNFKIRVHGHWYGSGAMVDAEFVGYTWQGTNGSIDGSAGAVINYSCVDNGNENWSKYIGIDGNGNLAIAIGDTGSLIYYGRLAVDAWIATTGTDYSTGWYIDQNTVSNFGWKDIHNVTTTRRTSANDFWVNGIMDASSQYQLNATTVIDSSRNLVNIGTGSFSGTVQVGSSSSNTNLYIGNATAGGDGRTQIMPNGSSINGVSGDLLSIAQSGVAWQFALGKSGDFGANGSIRGSSFYQGTTPILDTGRNLYNITTATLGNSSQGANNNLKVGGTVTFGTLKGKNDAGTDGALIIRNLAELRFTDNNQWDWNQWAGIKFTQASNLLSIGGPNGSAFQSNSAPPAVSINFDGVSSIQVNGTQLSDGNRNLSNVGTINSGTITTPSIYINNTNTNLNQGSNTALRVNTSYGYIDIGPQNSSYAHIYTSIGGGFYFNQQITSTGQITASSLNATSGYQLNGTTVIDGSKNLTNIGTINSGAITTTGVTSNGTINIASGVLNIGGTQTIDASRNLTNIGTINSGVITTTGITNSGIITNNASNAGIEHGSQTASNTPYIDFHSSGYNNDYDARIIATGGSSGNVAGGNLVLNTSNVLINNSNSTFYYPSPFTVHKSGDNWHVAIGDYNTGMLSIGGATSNGAVIQAHSFSNGSRGTQRDLYLQRDGGKVGIGTSNPGYTLDVNGSIHTNGTITGATNVFTHHGAMSNGDLNTATTAGFYYGSNMSNAPSTDWWMVQVYNLSGDTVSSSGYVAQVAYSVNQNALVYVRNCTNGTWQAWTQVGGGGMKARMARTINGSAGSSTPVNILSISGKGGRIVSAMVNCGGSENTTVNFIIDGVSVFSVVQNGGSYYYISPAVSSSPFYGGQTTWTFSSSTPLPPLIDLNWQNSVQITLSVSGTVSSNLDILYETE